MFVNPGEYPGDTIAISRLVAQIKQVQLDEVISERKETHGDFDVDDGGLRVTLDGKRSWSFYVSKQAGDYLHTCVRFVGDDKVYLAKGISKVMFDRNPDEWRDAHILTFDMATINKLIVDDQEFVKRNTRWFLDGREVELIRMTEVLNLLSTLRATGFAENALFQPVTKVTIVSDAFTYGIEIGDKHDQVLYLLRVTGRKSVFLVNEYIVDRIRELSADI